MAAQGRTELPIARIREELIEEAARLDRIRQTLAAESAVGDADRDATSELSGADQHPADLGSEMFERERAVSVLQRVEAKLADVQRALQRLEAGTYGTCEACGRAIPSARLQARPAARFCLDDQARAEQEVRAS